MKQTILRIIGAALVSSVISSVVILLATVLASSSRVPTTIQANSQRFVLFSHVLSSTQNPNKALATNETSAANGSVLAAEDIFQQGGKTSLTVNVPAIFNDTVTIKNQKLDLGNGQLTASNILYQITPGSGVSVSGGQNPTINNTGVLTLQGQNGNVNLTAGTGISLDGLKITNTGLTSLEAGTGISVSGNKITNTGLTSLTAGTGITVDGSTITNSDAGSLQNIFKNIAVSGQSTISAGSNTDTLTIAAGNGTTITTDPTSKTVTIGINPAQSGVLSVNSLGGALSIVGAGINTVSSNGTTITLTGTEADTLSSVTGRGNTSSSGISLTENGNTSSNYALQLKRNTDTSPNGYLIQALNANGTSTLFAVDANGAITTASVGTNALIDNSVTNAKLANSSLTITTGNGLSGGGTVSLGGTLTLNNTGVTSLQGSTGDITLTNGSGITINGTTITNSGVTGVNSATGNITINGGGINSVSTVGNTVTVTGNEADTLASVTGRGATTSSNVTFAGNVDLSALSSGGLLKAASTTGRINLAVAGTDYQVPLTFGNGLVNSSNTVSLGGTLASDLALATGGYNIDFTGTGKLGIGTNNPLAKLDVYGGGIRLGAANGINDILNTTVGSAPSGYLYWGNRTLCDSSGNCAGTSSALGGSGTTGYLSRFTGTYTVGSSLLYDNGTNIGVGTNNPLNKLDVNGSIGVSGTTVIDASRNLTNVLGVSTNLTPTSNDTYDLGSSSNEYNNIYGHNIYVTGNLISGGNGGGSGTFGYVQRNNGAIAPTNISDAILVGSTATSSANIKLASSSSDTSFINGNLAIGTTSATAKLTVAGNIVPSADNAYNLGSSNYEWNTLYANNIVGSSFTATSSGTFKDVIISGKTNQITDDTNLANGKDTFVYEVKKDIDGGAWISGEKVQSSSWYNETLDHTGSACALGSDDRCGSRSFPSKSIIVATSTSVYIYDAIDNTMWMKINRGTGYALNGSSVTVNAVFAYNGVVYIATSTNGLVTIDFINDRIYQYDYNNGSGGRAQFTGTIADRNSNKGYGSRQSWGQIASDQVSGVYARVINGKLYVAVSTLGGASVIDVTDERVVRYID